ncbi:hypothetical protein, partial [Alkalibacillus haloalkaliphilus]|uniref:hypothetical protein n=1 Tax=Alkalibacillus haloalkaliphilus TaxID=94136 RepID=UPI0029354EE6
GSGSGLSSGSSSGFTGFTGSIGYADTSVFIDSSHSTSLGDKQYLNAPQSNSIEMNSGSMSETIQHGCGRPHTKPVVEPQEE